jgi:hypothetical protein
MGACATTFPGKKSINAEKLSKKYGFPIPDLQGMPAAGMVEAC